MKKTFDFLFKFTSLLFIFSLTFILYSTPVSAKELPSNNSKVEIKFVDNNLHVFRKDLCLEKKESHFNNDGSISTSETYSGYFLYNDQQGVLGNIPLISTYSSSSQTEQNVYWKGSVTITYTADGTYAQFKKVSGYWTQLRGNSKLKNRKVYYACTLGITHKSATKKPSSNSFSYNTGFPKKKYGTGSIMGCNSTADVYSTTNGVKLGTLFVNCNKSF